MIVFNAHVPFPLCDSVPYSEAQKHSEFVDQWLGLCTSEIEKKLIEAGCRDSPPVTSQEHQTLWIGLESQRLLTPYTEIRYLLSELNLKPGDLIADLGAGYGRMAFVIAKHHPGVHFIGYEYVGERVKEGRKVLKTFNNPLLKLVHCDLSEPSFKPAFAQFYFIYDYGSRHAIEKTLHDLRRLAKEGPIVVVGRGRSSRDIIERNHPWLSQVIKPIHREHYSIYKSQEC